MTRRQQRGTQTRTAVLEATLKVLARSGPRGVTHRAVAAQAGTSLRATTYYFDGRQDLLAQALEHYADQAIARFEHLRMPADAMPVGGEDQLAGAASLLAQVVIGDVVDDRDGLVAEYELLLELGRDPSLEATYQRWQDALLAMLRSYTVAFGSDQPDLDARLVLATLRGLELEALAAPSRTVSRNDLEAAFRRLLASLVGQSETSPSR